MGLFAVASLLLSTPQTAFAGANQKRDLASQPDDGVRSSPGDWPFLRGANYDGHSAETHLVDSFDAAGPPVLWTHPLGVGYSAITVADNRAYTQYQTFGGQYLICLDADTGNTLWERRYDAPYDPAGLYPGPRATPTIARSRIYVVSPSGLISCFTADTGQTVWSLNVFERFAVEPVEFGYSCSAVIVDDKVLLPVGKPSASMVALDASTGSVVWHTGDDPISHVPAYPIEFEGRRLVVGYLRNTLDLFDLDTGALVLRIVRSTAYDEHAAWPIYREPYLWLSGPFQAGSELIELTDGGAAYRTVWKSRLLSNDVCSSVLVDDHLYGFDLHEAQSKMHRPSRGVFRCLNFSSGEPTWVNGNPRERRTLEEPETPSLASDRIGTPSPRADSTAPQTIGQASLIVSDDKLIIFNELGELIVGRANPERFEQLGRVRVLGGEICWTPPTLSNGRLFVRNHSRAACLLLADSRVSSTPTTKLTVSDIPQSHYYDWAELLLSVEPKYAMDLPTRGELWRWYEVMLAIYVVTGGMAYALAATVALIQAARRPRENLAQHHAASDMASGPHSRSPRAPIVRSIHAALAFTAGAAGTTLLSPWFGQFLFSWPLSLFVALQTATYAAQSRRAPDRLQRQRSLLVLAGFFFTCGLYFVLCRRLNLAFEWIFLASFIAALPLLVLARTLSRRDSPFAAEALTLVAAFSAYYWGSIGLLALKYGFPPD